jgi:5'-methylthioadenosine phosphorylase
MRLLILAQPLPPRALEHLGAFVEERKVATPYGQAGPFALRQPTNGRGIWILPYFGSPDHTDPRATLWAAKELGVQRILAWDSVTGLDHDLVRGDIVYPSDYIDWTKHQPTTFFAQTGAGYLPQIPPFCSDITAAIIRHLPAARPVVYLGDEGPRRETAAEARMYHLWGAHVRGLNLVPETYLAKELELCFAAIGVVTVLGADRAEGTAEGEVREADRAILAALPGIFADLPAPPTCGCDHLQAGSRQRGVLPADWRLWG